MSDTVTHVVDDPGAGHRLGTAAREALASEIRDWRRARPPAVLIDVRGNAWHHAPELDVDRETMDHSTIDAGYQSIIAALFELSCPVIVSLAGHVSGFGLALTMAADVRVATSATTLAAGEGRPLAALLGGASWLTTRIAGAGSFAQLAWTCGALPADEAARRGLLSIVTDEPGAARAVVDRIAADPVGNSALKRALVSRQRTEFGTVLAYEAWLADVAGGGVA